MRIRANPKEVALVHCSGYLFTTQPYLENWATEKPRLSSYIFPRAVEIGRRLLPIFPHLAFRETFPTWKHLFTEPPSNPFKNKAVDFGQRPRPLHNRCTRTGTCVRWGMAVAYSRYKFVTVSLPKRFRKSRFNSETAVRRFQK
jgi:hypothetical protein